MPPRFVLSASGFLYKILPTLVQHNLKRKTETANNIRHLNPTTTIKTQNYKTETARDISLKPYGNNQNTKLNYKTIKDS